MFYLVGLGLFDEKDISLKGLECLKNVDKIYAEFFTSRLFGSSFEAIEELIHNLFMKKKTESKEDILHASAYDSNLGLVDDKFWS